MFNLLVDDLPYCVIIGGEKYAINADVRTMSKITALIENDEEGAVSKQLALFYPDAPKDPLAAISALVDFCQTPMNNYGVKNRAGRETLSDGNRIYSLTHDANLVYAAFYQQYGIKDIGGLHWFEFRALMDGLTDGCQFVKVMRYRSIKIDSKMSKSEKSFYRKMKQLYALPDNRPAGVKDNSFANVIMKL